MPVFRHAAIVSALGMLASGVCSWACAQEPVGNSTQDPPLQAARLSYAQGSVSLQPAGVQDWSAATLNRPLTVGDQLWSDAGSRAELEFSNAAVRMNENSALSLLDLTDQGEQLRLSGGSIVVAVRSGDPNLSLEIDAPNAAISLLQPGEYRIEVDATGTTVLRVRSGAAQATDSAGRAVSLQAGQGGQFGAHGAFDVASVAPADDFDRWSEIREQRWARAASAGQYMAEDVVGAEDLGNYGQWQQLPDYGEVWFPTRVSPDWAPYGDGQWAWVSPWGWSWVDNAPWGYAPFHYGRWTYFNQHWGWVPAPPHHHAVYAPALVAWVGGPGNGGSVGWLPLAPGEVYVPGYPASARYAQNINLSNSAGINPGSLTRIEASPGLQDHYANHGAPRALTVVAQNRFLSGQNIAGHSIGAPFWQQLAPTPRAPAIEPARSSLLGSTPARVARPPANIEQRRVLARRPPPTQPLQFDRQLEAIRANHGRAVVPARDADASGFARPDVQVIRAQPAALPAPSPPAPAREQGLRIPERSPGFQRSPQSQSSSPAITTEQQQRNWRDQQQRSSAPGLEPRAPRAGEDRGERGAGASAPQPALPRVAPQPAVSPRPQPEPQLAPMRPVPPAPPPRPPAPQQQQQQQQQSPQPQPHDHPGPRTPRGPLPP